MDRMESTRQQKVGKQIQKDISDILLKEGAEYVRGAMVSVTVVRVSPDFALAKVYVSIFPFEKSQEILGRLQSNAWFFRRALGQRIRNQIKQIPEVAFFLDDSMEYVENIEQLLK